MVEVLTVQMIPGLIPEAAVGRGTAIVVGLVIAHVTEQVRYETFYVMSAQKSYRTESITVAQDELSLREICGLHIGGLTSWELCHRGSPIVYSNIWFTTKSITTASIVEAVGKRSQDAEVDEDRAGEHYRGNTTTRTYPSHPYILRETRIDVAI